MSVFDLVALLLVHRRLFLIQPAYLRLPTLSAAKELQMQDWKRIRLYRVAAALALIGGAAVSLPVFAARHASRTNCKFSAERRPHVFCFSITSSGQHRICFDHIIWFAILNSPNFRIRSLVIC
ncbi:hypothetical protein [Rhizobium bangladeshense]|uniref:hypothetical protein n=1 Tax=Rhizobium bangladeshense TaxID=1138189 RepID=UPI0007E5B8FD|nr:hypothetical protein [Rhizobium bangladeshense]